MPVPVFLMLCLIVLAAAIYGCFESFLVGRTVFDGRCAACRYDLRGLPDRGLCPECGAGFDKREVRQVAVRRFQGDRVWKIALILLLTGLVFAVKPTYELNWFLIHGYGWRRSPCLAFVWAQRDDEMALEIVLATCYFLWGVLLVGGLRFWIAAPLHAGALVALALAAFPLSMLPPQAAVLVILGAICGLVGLVFWLTLPPPLREPADHGPPAAQP